VLVSKRYLSISSLSPENQPPSLPPYLTALVLIFFDVGEVDSMTTKKGDKGTHSRRERDGPIGCFCERKQLQQIL